MFLEELQQLVAKGETEKIEFKKTTGQRTEGAKSVCAMLNGLGGFVIFGVADHREILGQHVTTKTLQDLAFELRRIEPPAFPEVESLEIGHEKTVIIVRVPGTRGTYTYDHRAYVGIQLLRTPFTSLGSLNAGAQEP